MLCLLLFGCSLQSKSWLVCTCRWAPECFHVCIPLCMWADSEQLNVNECRQLPEIVGAVLWSRLFSRAE